MCSLIIHTCMSQSETRRFDPTFPIFVSPKNFVLASWVRFIVQPGTHCLQRFGFADGQTEFDRLDSHFNVVIIGIGKVVWIDDGFIIRIFGIQPNISPGFWPCVVRKYCPGLSVKDWFEICVPNSICSSMSITDSCSII